MGFKTGMIILLAAALLIGSLACASSDGSDSSSANQPFVSQGQSESPTSSSAQVVDTDMYLLQKSESIQEYNNGTIKHNWQYERDEHGNVISITQEATATGSKTADPNYSTTSFDVDRYGYIAASHYSDNGESLSTLYRNEIDELGRIVSRTADIGPLTISVSFAYYGDTDNLATEAYIVNIADGEGKFGPAESAAIVARVSNSYYSQSVCWAFWGTAWLQHYVLADEGYASNSMIVRYAEDGQLTSVDYSDEFEPKYTSNRSASSLDERKGRTITTENNGVETVCTYDEHGKTTRAVTSYPESAADGMKSQDTLTSYGHFANPSRAIAIFERLYTT